MENNKTKIVSVVAIIALAIVLIGATFAYFQAQTGTGSSTDVKINANTVDTLTFETGSAISLNLNQDNFASGKASLSSSTTAKAHLSANNKTNSAKGNYNIYINISDNNFMYTQNTSTPELILTIKDSSNNEITSIDNLTYVTATDNLGTVIKGFDITNKTGILTLLSNHEISTTSTKTDTWTITLTFVNYNKDQSKNAGKSFNSQIIITKDDYSDYVPTTINTLSASKSGTNLTVNASTSLGTTNISKYYYAIKETNVLAYNASNIQKLSNTLAANDLTFTSSTSSSHTFSNIQDNKNYTIYAYIEDAKKLKSNIYEYSYTSNSYILPSITKVNITNTTSSSISLNITATKGTNNITKYLYSIDNGNTFTENTTNTYTFSKLNKNTNYRIIIKVMDSNNKYSNEYIVNQSTSDSLPISDYVIAQYTGTQGDNGLYYHNSSLANGAGDNSYRYAGANPNNFVCFGSDASTCPDDNLYRIIGVIDGKVKLIKADYANSNLLGTDGDYSTTTYSKSDVSTYKGKLTSINTYYWNSESVCYTSGGDFQKADQNVNYTVKLLGSSSLLAFDVNNCNNWSYSKLNTINLNTNYINNIGDSWANKIETTTWKVGGNTYANIRDAVPSIVYKNEITTPAESTIYDAKIGLIYVSDYMYGATLDKWTLVGFSASYSTKDYSAATSVNWMDMGISEWTISRISEESNYVISVGGGVCWNDVVEYIVVRPVFNLTPSVTYISGTGTETDPIRIS